MNNWVLLHAGERPPTLAPEQFICLAMEHGGILRVMYRFVKNIRGSIAGYIIQDQATPVANEWQHMSQPMTQHSMRHAAYATQHTTHQ